MYAVLCQLSLSPEMFTSYILCVNVRSSRQVEKHETWRKKSRCMKSDWSRRAICPHLGNPPILLWENIFDVFFAYLLFGENIFDEIFQPMSSLEQNSKQTCSLPSSQKPTSSSLRKYIWRNLWTLIFIAAQLLSCKDCCRVSCPSLRVIKIIVNILIKQFFKTGTFQVFLFDKEISPAGAVGLHLLVLSCC